MRVYTLITISAVCIGVLTASCDTPLNTENAYHHFPMEQGNYWDYLSNSPDSYPDFKITCGNKQEYNSGLIAWRLMKEYQYTYQYLYWSRTGRYLREYDSILGENYVEYIMFPLDVGTAWSSGTDGYTVTCYGRETVVTPRFEFADCYKIGYEADGGIYECYWYKPDYGFVKMGRGSSIDNISEFVVLNDFYIKGLE